MTRAKAKPVRKSLGEDNDIKVLSLCSTFLYYNRIALKNIEIFRNYFTPLCSLRYTVLDICQHVNALY